MNQMSLMADTVTKSAFSSLSGDNVIMTNIDSSNISSRRHIDFVVDGNENGTSFDQDQVVLSKSTSTGADYYARGSAEAATESALTLVKIQHVSSCFSVQHYLVHSCSPSCISIVDLLKFVF